MGFPVRHIKAHKAHPTPIFPPIISVGFSQYLPAEFHPPNTLPLVELSLPEEILRVWQRSPLSKYQRGENSETNQLDRLREFLKDEVQN